MAIPIGEYIDIRSKVLQGTVGGRDFSGLVFTTDSMKTTVPAAYAAIKADYAAGKPVALGKDDFAQCFDSDSAIALFASKYFGFSGGNHTPAVLNVALASGTAKASFDAVTADFSNYGAATFLGSFPIGTKSSGGLLDVASAVEGSGNILAVAVDGENATAAATAFAGFQNTSVTVATPEDESGSGDGENFGAWMFLAWYASVDYSGDSASSAIDYVQFGGVAPEVSTVAKKREYDAAHLNYIGLVQVNGQNLSFYQTGVNMDGTDSGVIRDKLWLEGEIQAGWFNLNNGTVRVEASYVGAAKVRAMVVGVATRAIDNGVILIDKPLTEAQIAEIASITGNATAADSVVNTGYYVDTKILPDGDRYVCQYTFVYAKGDHIGKVTGANYLV